MSKLTTYSLEEERLHVLTHGAGFVFALIGSVFLLMNTSVSLWAVIVYCCSLLAVFASSTSYHMTIEPRRRYLLRKVDHICIYLLIAGTNTPFVWYYMDTPWRTIYLTAIWSVALIGILLKINWFSAFEKISVPFYVFMGAFGIWAVYIIYDKATPLTLWLIALGGLSYLIGVLFYIKKEMKYHHVYWHLWVILAAAFHFWAVYGIS